VADAYAAAGQRQQMADAFELGASDVHAGPAFSGLLQALNYLCEQALDAYQVNVPPQVRAARIADAHNAKLNRPQQYQRGGWIQYVMTQNGPEPLEARHSCIDCQYYLVKQLQPIADAILLPLGDSFVALTSAQKALF